MRSGLLIIIFFLSILSKSAAQNFDENNFIRYTTKNGLTSNFITAIQQDSYGYLWVATQKGLNRFDGNSFQHFYSDTSSNSLPQDNVYNLKWLDKDQLAVVTLSGLHIINTTTLKGRNLIIPPDSLKSLSRVNSVFDVISDKKGNIFIITRTGFYHFNHKDELVFRYDHYSREFIETKGGQFGWNLIVIEPHTALLSTTNGLYVYNISQKDLHPVSNNDIEFYRQIAPANKIFWFSHIDEKLFSTIVKGSGELFLFDIAHKTKHAVIDSLSFHNKLVQGSWLVQVNDTLFAITAAPNGFYLIRRDPITGNYSFNQGTYLEDHSCSSVFVDNKRRLWVGTTMGLLLQKRSGEWVEQKTILQNDDPLSNIRRIASITVLNNKVFAGTNFGQLFVLSRDSLQLVKKIDSLRGGYSVINNIIPLTQDTLLIGTAGVWLNSENLTFGNLAVPNSYVSASFMLKDVHQNIYLHKNRDTLFYRGSNDKWFTNKNYTGLSKLRNPTQIAEDPKGNFWFAGDGIMRFNNSSKKFDLLLDSFPAIKIPRKNIISNLVFDNNGRIYFGLLENGVIIYDPEQKKFTQLSRSDGLPDNNIRSIILIKNKLWLATDVGLANYDLVTSKISSFGSTDGFLSDDFTASSLYYDSADNHLYFALKNDVFRFNPDKLLKNNLPPDFFIENIHITGKENIYHPVDKISLSYKYNSLVINLASVNFEDASLQKFAYRFVRNGSESWEEIGSQRSIILSNLSPGNYKLQVKVYIRNNSWPEQMKEINIAILPPFWKTIWFYIFSFLLLAGIAYFLHRRRINHIAQKANIDKQLAETEMKALHSQMNPHFIFNCLNSIREMILNNENEQASLYLSKFARLIRITLDHSSRSFVSLEDTIDYLQRYLEMEQIRKSNFRYVLNVDENLQPQDIFLPPMLIQPFIENAIWHGGQPGKEMHLTLKFKRENDKLVCIVEDDGIGIEISLKNKEPELNYHSVGISNIKQRIHVLNEKYNLKSTIEIQDKSSLHLNGDTGTIVTLHLPIKTNESAL